MVFFYSGSTAPLQASSSTRSLGGYISNTPLPNSSISNLFSQLNLSMVLKNKRDTRLFVFQNLSPDPKEFSIWTEIPQDSLYKLKLNVVKPVTDPCNNKYFEQISSSEHLPYSVVLQEHEGIANLKNIGVLQPGEYIGIWVTREVLPEVVQSYTISSLDGNIGGCSQESISKLEARLLDNKVVEPKIIMNYN